MKKHLIGLQASPADLGCSMEECFPLLKKYGFESTFTKLGTAEERQKWAELTAANGLFYSSIHAPFKNAAKIWNDDLDGELAEKELLESVDACAEIEVPVLVVHPYIGFTLPYIPTETGLARFRRLAEYAEKKQVRVAIENVEGEEYLDYLLNGLKNYASVGFCLDTGHELCYNRGRNLLADYGDRLFYIHIDSNMGVTSPDGVITYRDDAHMLPFDGKVDMEYLAERLKKCNYEGVLMMELSRGNHTDRHTNDVYLAMTDDQYVAEAAARIKKLRDMIDG